jgi:acetyltransferase-like isoleucine patch superfamily enzyme
LKIDLNRLLQRYFVPQFLVAIYYSLKYRSYVSTQARVQLNGNISFGKGTVVKPYAILQTQGGQIRTGIDCAISSFNHISTGVKDVILGDHVRLGPHVTILGGSRNFKQKDILIVNQGSHHEEVIIGDDVLVGAGVVILPGCKIGKGAVIGAMSMVNQDVDAYTIVAGVPARVIGNRL